MDFGLLLLLLLLLIIIIIIITCKNLTILINPLALILFQVSCECGSTLFNILRDKPVASTP